MVSRGARGDGRRLPRCPFSAAVTIATVPPGFEVVPGKDPNGWSFTWRLAPRRSELFLIATVLLFFNIHSEDQRQLLKKACSRGILGRSHCRKGLKSCDGIRCRRSSAFGGCCGTIYQKVGTAFKTQQHAHEERFCRSPLRTASSFFPVSNDGKDNLATMNRLPTKLATTTGGLAH